MARGTHSLYSDTFLSDSGTVVSGVRRSGIKKVVLAMPVMVVLRVAAVSVSRDIRLGPLANGATAVDGVWPRASRPLSPGSELRTAEPAIATLCVDCRRSSRCCSSSLCRCSCMYRTYWVRCEGQASGSG